MRPVRIIIPVYLGLAETQRCLNSVAASCADSPQVSIEVVDDASPDGKLSAWLEAAVAAFGDRWSLFRHSDNLGFTQTCNDAMERAGSTDVLLLNADTVVAGDWVERMQAQALAADDVGTVTPFSNNATICSFPDFCADNPLPDGWSLAELDRCFARSNHGQSVALPTAVGFCLYLRAECLQEVGHFDAQRYPRGYGEENDFSMRASAAGWRHLLAADVFVFHHGSTSFGESRFELMQSAQQQLRADHPQYFERVQRFIAIDPVQPLRAAVLTAMRTGA